MATAVLSGCAIRNHSQSVKVNADDTSVPFTLHDNRILLDVKVNGQGPYTFMFDTGGARSNSMTPQVAKELGLELRPGPDASGAGSGKQRMWLTEVKSYSVGDLVAENQEMIVLDMGVIKRAFAFPRLDGVIGFDVLRKAVTCIDFEKQILTFKEAGGDCFTDKEKSILALRIEHDSPIITGAVNGIKTEFFVDTGDRSAFSLFQKFGKSSGLENKFEGRPKIISGHGIGGPIPAKLTTVDEVQLGTDIKIENVLSRLPLTTGGFFAKSSLGGSVGNEILRRFNLVLDYSKNEIRLVKNKHFHEPFKFVPPIEN